jgi:2-polyprenyl-3-methyl-5-hydroxy-6-metoxy-1,4-benzoquinol methylase
MVDTIAINNSQLFFMPTERLVSESQDNQEKDIYIGLSNDSDLTPLAYYRLGEIENRNKSTEKSYYYHRKAFELDKNLSSKITSPDHPHHDYQYREVEDTKIEKCPLCNNNSHLHSCYNVITNTDFVPGFSPIRKWRICKDCNHIFAENYPKELQRILSTTAPEQHMNPSIHLLPLLGNKLSEVKKFTKGNRLLEIGTGAGELTSVAKELLFDITGIEIRPIYAKNVSNRLNVPIYSIDFMDFETDDIFDILILGDVLEHVPNPSVMIEKAYNLLDKEGVIWISTPNFESAFSYIMKDKDPMWRVCEHLNYFSYRSLKKTLENTGFKTVDYKISQHYNGCMEVTAIKTEN